MNDVLVANWYSEDKFSGELTYFKDIKQPETFNYSITDNTLIYKGAFKNGTSFTVKVRFITDGTPYKSEMGWRIENATI